MTGKKNLKYLCLWKSTTPPSINCNVKKNPGQEELENLRTCLKHSHESTSSSTPCCFCYFVHLLQSLQQFPNLSNHQFMSCSYFQLHPVRIQKNDNTYAVWRVHAVHCLFSRKLNIPILNVHNINSILCACNSKIASTFCTEEKPQSLNLSLYCVSTSVFYCDVQTLSDLRT